MKEKSVGILGAGQLASFIAQRLQARESHIIVYAQTESDPGIEYSHQVIVGHKSDKERLLRFFELCDVVILESEFFQVELLRELQEKTQTKIYPELSAFEQLATKKKQKEFFIQADIPFASTIEIKSNELPQETQFPLMLKKSYGSYDGLGNLIVKDLDEFQKQINNFSSHFSEEILAEELLDIDYEFACMLVKSEEKTEVLYPVDTIQQDSICHIVRAPSMMSEADLIKLKQYMNRIAETLTGSGIFAFEFFKTKDGRILVNEAAPRVHNSYHFSIEGLTESQFELMVRVALGEEIPKSELKYMSCSMINIIGQRNTENYHLEIPHIDLAIEMKTHLYGKKESRVGRKLGHVTIWGEEDTLQIAKHISKEYKI
ncbi:MAG: hypothetical protein CME62_11670 [Halobacteriovoraceae bacterium]|nr:hypothetical protein [Halobacteriovoraceae bacterium]|tara:strand:- start:8131 stop:9252 length:1122 start_codon:yes stop_codon:yes gene_type:complete